MRRWALEPGGRGGVSLDVSTLDGFEALGEAYAERAAPRAEPTPAVEALAARLAAQAADTRAAALALYRFVATEIRYVASFQGDGRVVPRAPDEVLAEGWGDCKDHAALLQALLAARGIGSVPALIGLRPEPELWGAPGLGQLNHVITYVPSLDLYLDSTAPYAPFGLLPVGEYDKPVVLAEPGRARLARTPLLPPEPLVLRTVTEARIGADDVVSGTTTTEASGPQAIALRSMAAWFEGRGRSAASGQMRLLGTPGTGAFRFEPPDRMPDRASDGAGYQAARAVPAGRGAAGWGRGAVRAAGRAGRVRAAGAGAARRVRGGCALSAGHGDGGARAGAAEGSDARRRAAGDAGGGGLGRGGAGAV